MEFFHSFLWGWGIGIGIVLLFLFVRWLIDFVDRRL